MDTKQQIILELEKAEHAFNRELGKHQLNDAYELLIGLNLGEDAQEIVTEIITGAFSQDAFAGFLRYDSIVQRIQIAIIRLSR